ncbi:MAG TPA: hypothetical protein VGR37_23930 [Longimicrobiaceae bacterium]|nr:hypothetical protein [Longimicrobiaceae bacterium]
MLDLDSPRWGELMHAYGSAHNLPDVLRQVQTELSADVQPDEDEPERALESAWFELASAICPMGEVNPASFAAVPHIVALAAKYDIEIRAQLLQLVARVEAGRHRPGAPSVPDDLEQAYRASISRIPHLVAARAGDEWDPTTAQALAGILLVAKGHPQLGMAVIELSEELQCPRCESTFSLPGWDLSAEDGDW